MDAGRVEGALRPHWPGVRLMTPAEPMTGGFWATMYRLAVEGQPDGVPGDLVLRIAPENDAGAKEAAVQKAVAELGCPTPAVYVIGGREGDLGGWWSVMGFAAGAPLLEGLDGISALRRAPNILRTMPQQLAVVMARTHSLDPEPVRSAVRRASPDATITLSAVLENFDGGARALGRSDLTDAIAQLAERRPDRVDREVLCHGDLHPFNVLRTGDDLTLLDWTGALVGDPAYDVAFTAFVLGHPPLALPRPLSAVLGRLARVLARRFVAAYQQAAPSSSLDAIEWYTALHCARVLLELGALRVDRGAEADGHPWQSIVTDAAELLSIEAGVPVEP